MIILFSIKIEILILIHVITVDNLYLYLTHVRFSAVLTAYFPTEFAASAKIMGFTKIEKNRKKQKNNRNKKTVQEIKTRNKEEFNRKIRLQQRKKTEKLKQEVKIKKQDRNN